jgi:2-(1,2-epoxy-1,2-dihydrophenyl)acetyl-CoA isomerase
MVLEVTRDGAVLELTLNRPDALNAFTVELHDALAGALKAARSPDIRAVIITGAGRAFSAGQDLAEAQNADTGPGERIRRYYNPNLRALRALDKPVVAAVNGVAAGAGVGLALACDVRVASAKASLVPAFIAIGLVPDSGLSWTATRILGEARAFDWLTTNRRLSANEALDWGLLTEVTEPERTLERARERAAELAETPGTAAAMTKRLLAQAVSGTFEDQLELERQLQQAASEDPAYATSIAAFLDRRPLPAR